MSIDKYGAVVVLRVAAACAPFATRGLDLLHHERDTRADEESQVRTLDDRFCSVPLEPTVAGRDYGDTYADDLTAYYYWRDANE